MRRLIAAAVALAVAGVVVPGSASPPAQAGRPTTGGFATDNVDHIRHIPISNNGVGGRLIGDFFYTNDQNKIMIFDVSGNPEDPTLVGVLPMPQEWQLNREDIDGNGKLLVVPNTVSSLYDGSPPPSDCTGANCYTSALYVIDVEDKQNPTILSKLIGGGSHTSSCVLNCRWVYNSNGAIIDLRDPSDPKMTDFRWGEGKPAQSGHDVEEIAPGLVLTASQPIMLLDVRKDPRRPKLLAAGANDDGRFIHTTRWARRGKDRFALVSGETTFNGRCSESAAAFMTWDASKWRKTRTFRMIDEYRMENGLPTEGQVPAGRNCSSHWFEPHPKFRNGGIVAHAFFEFGTRFLEVNRKGKIEEIGYFLPYAGSTSASYWVTDEIVYAVDYHRGIDILHFDPKK